MVMKDKLIKNHHKGSYYRARQFGIGFGVACALAAIVAVQTFISMDSAQVQKLNAQEETETDSGEDALTPEYQNYADEQ